MIDSTVFQQLVAQAVPLYQAGRPQEAAIPLRYAIGFEPAHAEILHMLGVIAQQLGRSERAVVLISRAIVAGGGSAIHLNNRGIVLQSLGRPEAALADFDAALRVDPDYAGAHYNRGLALRDLARLEDAIAAYDASLRLAPDSHESHNNRGIALYRLDRLEEAAKACQCSLVIRPSHGPAWSNLGNAVSDQGRPGESLVSYQRANCIKPDDAKAHCNRGVALWEIGRLSDALFALQTAVCIAPDMAETYNNLSRCSREAGSTASALRAAQLNLYLDPNMTEAQLNLGCALMELGSVADALAAFRTACRLDPVDDKAHSNVLFALSHLSEIDAAELFQEHRRFAEIFEQPLAAQPASPAPAPASTQAELRVGFVSADLRDHAVAYYLEPILKHLTAREELVLFAYANSPIEDAVSRRLEALFAAWVPCASMSDDRLAARIRADRIDILIDLSGHTAGNRLLTFARKPAPIQASWIGYPGTTGLTTMDYYLADRFFLPAGRFDDQFSETILHLPALAPFLPYRDAPQVNPLPAKAKGHITFGSFNRLSKINASVVRLWSRLMRALPDSRLLIGGLPQDGSADARLLGWFAAEQIGPERLELHPRAGMVRYLELHHQVDLCLDSFPYTSGTTINHALWMGVPTLTLTGDTPSSWLGAGLLGQVGLDAFVADNPENFVRLGESWAQNFDGLAAIRAGLRQRCDDTPIRRPEVIADALFEAFQEMRRRQ